MNMTIFFEKYGVVTGSTSKCAIFVYVSESPSSPQCIPDIAVWNSPIAMSSFALFRDIFLPEP